MSARHLAEAPKIAFLTPYDTGHHNLHYTKPITLRITADDLGNKNPIAPANEILVAMMSKSFIAGFSKP